jgi:hypothetical protein
MKPKPNQIWILLAGIFAAAGAVLSYRLSLRVSYETFKLLNIVGICSDFLGLLVISYILTARAILKSLAANWLTLCVGHIMLFVPVGMLITASICSFFSFPSAAKTTKLSVSLFAYGIVPIILLEDFALIPRWKRFSNPDARLKFLGGFLLIGGMLVQLVAAILDFSS